MICIDIFRTLRNIEIGTVLISITRCATVLSISDVYCADERIGSKEITLMYRMMLFSLLMPTNVANAMTGLLT